MFAKTHKLVIFMFSIGLSFLLGAVVAQGAGYPNKPIKLIVTAAAGGGEDIEARGVALYLEKYLGVRIIIEDQPGAGGKIAFEKFQKTAPDGYSLITYSFPKSIIMEYLSKTGYRTKDFTPVFLWSRFDSFISVHSDTWKTFDEFLKDAKGRTMNAGIAGIAGTAHLTGLMMVEKLGIKVQWIPYAGGAGTYAALAGKHIDMALSGASGVPLVESGTLRLLMCLSDRRNPFFPDIPTPRDLGIDIDPIAVVRGVEAPPRTSPAIVKVLEEAFGKVVRDPGYIEWAKRNKVMVAPVKAKEFRTIVDETYPVVEKFQHLLRPK